MNGRRSLSSEADTDTEEVFIMHKIKLLVRFLIRTFNKILHMTKEEYLKIYRKYSYMSNEKLEENLKDLYEKRYIEHNIDVFTEHRIAARVRLERNRSGESLIFHMKELQVKKSC
jgi:hypothetical protein